MVQPLESYDGIITSWLGIDLYENIWAFQARQTGTLILS